MPRDADDALSELEREFELEMDGPEPSSESGDLAEEFEALVEGGSPERESGNGAPDSYAERLYELAQREFESESEADAAVHEVLNDMEREYFWGSLKKLGKRLKLGKIVNKAWQLAKDKVPALNALQSVSALARGNLKGMLSNAIKAGLGAAVPGAGAFLPAVLGALGFQAADNPETNREAWDNVTEVAREAYGHLAENLHENAHEPEEASRLASESFQTAIRKVSDGVRRTSYARPSYGGGSRLRVIHLRPGDEIVIRVHR